MTKNYNTKQKNQILDIIREKKQGHFTCDEICDLARKHGNSVAPSTVYRHLDRLVRDGALRKYVPEAGESACYQLKNNCGEHFHLKCTLCGRLEHLSCKSLDTIQTHVESEHGFVIDPARTVFYGICGECRAK